MSPAQWVCFITLTVLALMAKSSTDYAVFMTGAILLWALTKAPTTKKSDSTQGDK